MWTNDGHNTHCAVRRHYRGKVSHKFMSSFTLNWNQKVTLWVIELLLINAYYGHYTKIFKSCFSWNLFFRCVQLPSLEPVDVPAEQCTVSVEGQDCQEVRQDIKKFGWIVLHIREQLQQWTFWIVLLLQIFHPNSRINYGNPAKIVFFPFCEDDQWGFSFNSFEYLLLTLQEL